MLGLGRLTLASALIWAALVPAAFAATEAGDAGELPATAQDLGAETALDAITGSIGSDTDRDLYRVCLSGGGSFSASTVGGTMVDSQLFLLNAAGHGVYANDDAPGVLGQSELPAHDVLTPASAGVYYLAITRYNQDPVTAAGPRLFPDVVFTIGPSSSNPATVIAGWTNGRTGSFGDYRIALTGVVTCPAPDETAPTVDLRTPPDGAIYTRGESIEADYDCADEQGGSGLASCGGPVPDGVLIDTASAGPHSFKVTARDVAGNEHAVTHSYTVLDQDAPTIDLRTPPDGVTYGRGEQVLADYDCADEDGGSGLDSCVGDAADGAALDTAALGAHSFAVTARDVAGNERSLTHGYTVVDRTDPTIALRSPTDGAVYAQNQQVLADYDCADEDGGSGLDSCVGDVADGAAVDTAALGAHSFTVTARDQAGNESVRTVSYTVSGGGFVFEGFLPPLDNPPAVNKVRAGKLVLVRFRLGGDQGKDVLADGFPRSGRVTCGSGADADPNTAEPTRSPWWWHHSRGGDVRYHPWNQTYTYVWQTDRGWAGSCRQLIVKLSDGSVHRANLAFAARHPHWHWHWRGHRHHR
jgi:hypothetical protein